MCAAHVREEQENMAKRTFDEILNELWVQRDPALAWFHLTNAVADGLMTVELQHRYTILFDAETEEYEAIHMPRPPQTPRPETLAVLARDRQNVHTAPVTKATTSSLEMLLKVKVPADQDTRAEIAACWKGENKTALERVGNDMRMWYRIALCRKKDDFLYKRALDGLWALIRASKHKKELTQRLWEECNESCAMCFEGHISRLCNVMVGFDDAFKAEIPIGELLQQKMAAIAEQDVTKEHKIGAAWGVFEELKIPLAERSAWIDAF